MGKVSKKLFTVDDYNHKVDAGILGEDDRVELIRGEVLLMSPIGPPHNGTILRANHGLSELQAGEYRKIRALRRGEILAPQLFPDCRIPIEILLP